MKDELKCAFTGKAFWISALIMVICYLSFSVPSWVGSVDWGTEYRPSALQQAVEAIFFGGVIFLLPFCASASYATRQVDEIRSGFIHLKVARSSVSRYGWNKLLTSAISGAVVVGFAYAVHACIWNVIALPYDPITYPYHELPFRDGTFYANWHMISHALPIYLYMTVMIGVFGAFWAIISLAVSVWVPDKLLVITIPACIYRLWSGGFYRYAFGWQAPHPTDLFFDDTTPQLLLWTILMYVVQITFAIVLYFRGLRRREQHG